MRKIDKWNEARIVQCIWVERKNLGQDFYFEPNLLR